MRDRRAVGQNFGLEELGGFADSLAAPFQGYIRVYKFHLGGTMLFWQEWGTPLLFLHLTPKSS